MATDTKVKKDADKEAKAANADKGDKLLGKALGAVAAKEVEDETNESTDESTSETTPKVSATGAETDKEEPAEAVDVNSTLIDKVSALSGDLATANASLATANAALTGAEVTMATAKADMGTLKAAASKACRIYAQQLGLPSVDYSAMSPDALAIAYLDLDSKFKISIPEGQASSTASTEGNDPQEVTGLHPISVAK